MVDLISATVVDCSLVAATPGVAVVLDMALLVSILLPLLPLSFSQRVSVVGFAEAAVGLDGAELVSGSEAATREAISGVLVFKKTL